MKKKQSSNHRTASTVHLHTVAVVPKNEAITVKEILLSFLLEHSFSWPTGFLMIVTIELTKPNRETFVENHKKVSFNIASEWQKSNETLLVIFKQYNRDEIFHYYYFQAIYEGSEEYASTRKVSSRSSAANLCHPPPRELPGAIPPTKNNLYNHAHLPALVKSPPPSGAELTLKRPRK